MAGSQWVATLVNVPTRTLPATSVCSASAVWRSSRSSATMARIWGMMRSPSGVSRAPVRVRFSSGSPSSASTAATIWLTPDWVSPSSSAALVRDARSTTFSTTAYFFVSIL